MNDLDDKAHEKPIELVIFDLDGVLVDSELISARVIIDLAQEHGAAFDLVHVWQNFIGKSFSTVTGSIEADFGINLPSDFEQIYLERLGRCFDEELQPLADARETTAALQVNCCIATSSPMERAVNSLRRTGMFHFFENRIYCASMVERPKPSPDLFEFACKDQSVTPSKALVIEDSVAGLTAGIAAGIRTVRFVGGSHLIGQRSINVPPEGVERTIDTWKQFRSYYPCLF